MSELIKSTIRDQAKALYLSDYSIEDICAKLNLPIKHIETMIYGLSGDGTDPNSWMFQKNRMTKASITGFVVNKLAVFDRINGLASTVLSKSMHTLLESLQGNSSEPLDVSDMQKVADIIQKIDRISRLEEGEATDIIKRVGLSPEEARRIIKSDPISELEDIDLAEYREIYDNGDVEEH